MTGVDEVRDFYLARWGEPSRRADFTVGQYTIEIYKWAPEANGEGVDLYVTLGASSDPAPGRPASHRHEYFIGLTPGRDQVASPLAALGLYETREGEALGHGHTVPAGRPLWPGTDMNAFLLVPGREIIPDLSLGGEDHVEFLQAVPIFESELRFKTANGADALLEHWEKARTPFWDPDRKAEPAS